MTARIDGKAMAAELRARVAQAAAALAERIGRAPGLAVILVGEDPASEVYVRNKIRETRAAGMHSFECRLPADVTQAALHAHIDAYNADPTVDGILLQLPLPAGLDADAAIGCIAPDKDVDGLTEVNAGRLFHGRPGLVPCTPLGSMMMARATFGPLAGARAVVVGRSILVGKPLAILLQADNATVTIAHSRTRDLPAVCREADILFTAVGRPEMFDETYIAPGAVVIDIGINRIVEPDGRAKLVGDVKASAVAGIARALSPVPGGVGPMTIACLLRNTVEAAARRAGLPVPAAL